METETLTTGPAAVVLDSSRANALPTGHVLVANVAGMTDREVADLAGFCSRHFGYSVDRYDDPSATATVHLFND